MQTSQDFILSVLNIDCELIIRVLVDCKRKPESGSRLPELEATQPGPVVPQRSHRLSYAQCADSFKLKRVR